MNWLVIAAEAADEDISAAGWVIAALIIGAPIAWVVYYGWIEGDERRERREAKARAKWDARTGPTKPEKVIDFLIRAVETKDERQPVKQGRSYISQQTKFEVFRRSGGRCVKCYSRDNLEIDHIRPIAKGGSNHISNLQVLCRRCNRRKGHR